MYPKIDMYSNYEYIMQKQDIKTILLFILCSSIFLMSIFYLLFFYDYDLKKTYTGYIQPIESGYGIVLYVDELEPLSHSTLWINNQKTNFKIIEVHSIKSGYQILLQVDFEPNEFSNEFLKLTFQTSKTTWWQERMMI